MEYYGIADWKAWVLDDCEGKILYYPLSWIRFRGSTSSVIVSQRHPNKFYFSL